MTRITRADSGSRRWLSFSKAVSAAPQTVAGKPDDSAMIRAIRHDDVLPQMPPKKDLPDREIEILARWVKIGMPWPDNGTKAIIDTPTFRISAEQRQFWAFQPVKVVAPPTVKDAAWSRSDLDRYVLAGLEAKGLRPAKPADKHTLLRRATFDLTGLPPTPAEMDAFLRDETPDAFAKVVDRLLASSAYGRALGPSLARRGALR